jgi:hypothetical protein
VDSRRHRKGLAPRVVRAGEALFHHPTRPEAWTRWWAPDRLAWWVAVLFVVGSALFALGGGAASWPGDVPLAPGDLNGIFFVGSLFFTSAAWLQLMEAANGDVAEAGHPGPRRWRWIGWQPRNLGWLASVVQLVGTVLFNFNTADAAITGLDWVDEDLLVWTPDMIGCVCFLVASVLAWMEFSHGTASFAPRSVSWWIVVINLAGSVAFQVSALYSFVGPGAADAHALFLASLGTFAGALCFLLGALLLLPEMFDGEARSGAALAAETSP